MPLLREEPGNLRDAIAAASGKLDGLDQSFIEKDYWVTQVLRALQVNFPAGFVFKGGTSLSKGYQIIERFSEDVDILVVPLAGASIKDREEHLTNITLKVSEVLTLAATEARQPGRGRNASRADHLTYVSTVEPALQLAINPGKVLLETGYSSGHEPSEVVEITPLLNVALSPKQRFDDTKPFSVRALDPSRTLVEKLFALHHLATRRLADPRFQADRFGRHYYDIFKLLDHTATKRKLQRRADFSALVAEAERISGEHYGGTTPRPEDGFAASPAFAIPDPRLRSWLQEEYRSLLSLIPSEAERPSFGAVLRRIEEQADLL